MILTHIKDNKPIAIIMDNHEIVKAIDGKDEVALTAMDEVEIMLNYMKDYKVKE